jgi:hypothetical protein
MSYYIEGVNVYEEDYYVIRENSDIITYSDNVRYIRKTPIVIINNEDITFNFKNYILYNYDYSIIEELKRSETGIERVFSKEKSENTSIKTEKSSFESKYSKIKIKIDFGDNTNKTLIKSLTPSGKNSWDIITHHYNFTDKKYFDKEEKYIGEIRISINNVENLKDIVIIPFTIGKASSTIEGLKMNLLSANLTNDNKISFTFNVLNDNQIVFANTKNSMI